MALPWNVYSSFIIVNLARGGIESHELLFFQWTAHWMPRYIRPRLPLFNANWTGWERIPTIDSKANVN